MDKEAIKNFVEKIKSAKSIAIAGHKNPDGDSLCSVLALARLIELNFSKKPVCVYDGNIPDCLDGVPYRKSIKYFEHIDKTVPFDLAIILDYGTENHIGGFRPVIENAKNVLEIDHHKNDTPIADVGLNNEQASAVGEIIYDIMHGLNWKYDLDVLELIATSILTDTGNFKYARSGKCLRVMADLVDNGVCIEKISNLLNNKPRKTVIMEAGVAANAEFFYQGRLVVATIDKKNYKNLDGRGETVLNILGQIKGVEFIALLKHQKENQTGVSLRSRTKAITHIAAAIGGGGHSHAAGAVVQDNLENVKKKLIELFKGEK